MVSREHVIKTGARVEVRDARITDVDEIWDIFNIVVDEGVYIPVVAQVKNRNDRRSWFYELANNGDFCLVAMIKGDRKSERLAGQVTIESSAEWDGMEHVGILGILIHPDFRNIGVGRALIEEACEEAKRRGKKKIVLSVFHTNPRGIALYQSLGFDIVGTKRAQFRVDDAFVDEVIMEKFLVPADSLPIATMT